MLNCLKSIKNKITMKNVIKGIVLLIILIGLKELTKGISIAVLTIIITVLIGLGAWEMFKGQQKKIAVFIVLLLGAILLNQVEPYIIKFIQVEKADSAPLENEKTLSTVDEIENDTKKIDSEYFPNLSAENNRYIFFALSKESFSMTEGENSTNGNLSDFAWVTIILSKGSLCFGTF